MSISTISRVLEGGRVSFWHRFCFWVEYHIGPVYGNMGTNRLYGRWRVAYRDGALSHPMCARIAFDYACIFVGKVVRNALAGGKGEG